MQKEERKNAYRFFLHRMATAETAEELEINEIWALSCIDNMRGNTLEKDINDMITTLSVFSMKAGKKFEDV